jgi:integrase
MGVFERDPKTGRRCKKGQRGTWYYKFTVDGRPYRKAIPEATNKKQALIAEAAAKTDVFNAKYGRKGGQAIFSDFVWNEETQSSEYLEWVKANRKSWPFHRTYAPVIAEYFKGKRFCDITPKVIEQYRDYRLAQPSKRDGGTRSGNSVCRELAMLSAIFALAIKRDYYEGVNPVSSAKVDWPHEKKEKVRRKRTLSEEEEDLILSRMVGRYERLRAPFLTALYVGCRRGEMFQLEWDDINFDLHQIYFREEITKTGEDRRASLIEPAYSELLALKNQGVTEPTIFGISVYWASHLLRELLDKLIAEGLLEGPISGWHVCRHTRTTRGFKAGQRPDVIRDELGHKKFDQTFYYAHAGDEDSLRDARKLERRPKINPIVSTEAQDAENG